MREILFRGKRIDNGEWIEGHLIRHEDRRARICQSHTDIFCYEKDRSIIQTVAHEVDPYTVGLYTGLKDKNGKRIFEGDIVRATIERAEGCQSPRTENVVVCGTPIFSPFSNELSMSGLIEDYCFEVIGNITDNPELLEK